MHGYKSHRLKRHRPLWAAEMAAQQTQTADALALLINAVVDLDRQLTEVRRAATDNDQSQLVEHVRADLTGVGRQLFGKIAQEASDLRQIVNLISRKAGQSTQRIRCMFLVHAIESWDAQIDIYEAMRKDVRFEPLVVSINRRFPGDGSFRGEDLTSAALDDQGIAHLRLGMDPAWPALDILRALAPDVIFRQSQWEDDVPAAFGTEHLNFARLCAVPYAIATISQFAPSDTSVEGAAERSFDQAYHRMAWRVFCETEQSRSYFLQFRHCDPAKLIVSGYPKLTRLLRSINEPERWPIDSGAARRFRVIWAPHHSLGTNWLGFGVFDRVYARWLEWARMRTDIDFVLKPHPALFSTAVSTGVITQRAMDSFLAEWRTLPNCALELGIYGHLFAASDLMVTDGVSFLTEYPPFEKPLIFFDSGRHVPMNLVGDKALACAHHVSTFEGMCAAVDGYAQGAPWPLEVERAALLEMLLPNDRDPTDVILDAVAAGMTDDAPAGVYYN
jgi:hypothetical protein